MPSRRVLGPTQPRIQWVWRALSPGLKRPGRESGDSPPTSAQVEKIVAYTSTPPIRLYGVVLNQLSSGTSPYMYILYIGLSPAWCTASPVATQEFPNILWTRTFITVFAWTHYWSPSWARWIQSITPVPISLRSIFIFFLVTTSRFLIAIV
jgi:hypothetical protein